MPFPATAPAGLDQTSKPKRITNPLRLLILTPSDQSNQTIPVLLQSLTGVSVTTPPSSTDSGTENQSFAGYTTHAPLQISNKYYSADVPIWVDEIPTSSAPPEPSTTAVAGAGEEIESTPQWKTTFLSAEAREVRDAIGAIVLCVRNPALSISRAVPKEALEIATSTAGSSTIQTAIEEESKDAAERSDVRTIKELVGIVSELKTKIEEERNCGDEGDEGDDVVGGAEVPGILVLVDEHSASSYASKKKGSASGDDEGLGAEEPFSSPWWEEIFYEQGIFGMEVIQWTPSASSSTTNIDVPETRNMYGELEGLPRLKEVLSTHEWTASSSGGLHDDEEDEDDIMSFLNSGTRRDESAGFRFEVNQLEREMMGLRFAINGGDDDDDDNNELEDTELQVENLEALMMRMRAIKDMSSDLPESKRKAFAAKAVKDIMREF